MTSTKTEVRQPDPTYLIVRAGPFTFDLNDSLFPSASYNTLVVRSILFATQFGKAAPEITSTLRLFSTYPQSTCPQPCACKPEYRQSLSTFPVIPSSLYCHPYPISSYTSIKPSSPPCEEEPLRKKSGYIDTTKPAPGLAMMQASSKTTTQQPAMAEARYSLPATAGQSGRIKYADPRDLPSYPSPGLKSDGAAAGAAASLGWANQKSIDLWKPEKSNSASAAAMLAKDYKMAPSWEPNSSSAGAKAALIASASARKQATATTSTASRHDSWGNSAANQAFKQSLSVRKPAHATSTDGLGSLSAAQSAMPAPRRTRPRAKSTPVPKESYPDESRAAANALSAATAAHSPTKPKSPTETSGSVPYTNLPRKMFTSSPAIGPEADEQKRADVLHASAVAMAKKMYSQQQKMVDQTREAHRQSGDLSPADNQPRPYVNLQEAAYKLAQERLSKLHEEHQRNRDYQEYYGNGSSANQPQRRFTMKGKLRRRSSSDGDIKDEDKEQSERIRRQMSIFSSNLSKVDEQKRAKDREALLAAAQRNVKAKLQGMDEKISAETGMVPPSTMTDWEFKAHLAAQAKHSIPNENEGKLDIGGGMFMDPALIDEIAAKRVQPVLDEINEKAAIEKERQEIAKAEAEAKKRDEEKRKERDREIKEINRKIRESDRQEEKERRHREKMESKAKKEEEKAARAEEKRLSSSEKRKSKQPEAPTGDFVEAGEISQQHETNDADAPLESGRASHTKPTINTQKDIPSGSDTARSPSESGSPTHKMKEWLKSRFARPRGRSAAGENPPEERGFIGGVALTRLANESATSLDGRSASMREVAIAGKSGSKSVGESPRSPMGHDDVSPITSDDESERFVEARDDLEGPISPPPTLKDPSKHKSSSPTRDSRFREMME